MNVCLTVVTLLACCGVRPTVTSPMANVIPAVPSAPPTPEPRRAVPAGACRHNGHVYRDNAMFGSDATALKPTRSNQCVLCVCANGRVLCHLKTCPRLKCATTRHKKNDCCRQCSPPEKKSSGVCRSGDERHKNGSTWHPVVHPFGRLLCVVCHCLNGRISCDRVQCGRGTRPACDGKTANDQCCKHCRHKQTERPDVSAERNEGSNGNVSSTLKLCMSRTSDIIVSRYAARRQLTYIFANTRHRRADVLSWELHRGRVTKFSEQSLPTADIQALFGSSHNRRFKVVGTAKSKKIARFRRKVERFRRRCQKSGRCRKKALLKQIARLKLRRAKYKAKC